MRIEDRRAVEVLMGEGPVRGGSQEGVDPPVGAEEGGPVVAGEGLLISMKTLLVELEEIRRKPVHCSLVSYSFS